MISILYSIPEYGSRLPSTDPLLEIYLGPGSIVWVQVPGYGSRIPSADFGKKDKNHLFKISKNSFDF